MKILIHAVPERMWYVREFLLPALQAQGADQVEIWNDAEHAGNLAACMAAFAACDGEGGTWHLQDDVLPCRDFVRRCRELEDAGLVYGFCCRNFTDRLDAFGTVYAPDAWHSFQCVRIPDAWARECAEWVWGEHWRRESPMPELPILWELNKGDDSFFHEFIQCRHGDSIVENVRPNLVEHVDWLIGGSYLQPWRGYLARAEYWDDEDLIDALHDRLRARV